MKNPRRLTERERKKKNKTVLLPRFVVWVTHHHVSTLNLSIHHLTCSYNNNNNNHNKRSLLSIFWSKTIHDGCMMYENNCLHIKYKSLTRGVSKQTRDFLRTWEKFSGAWQDRRSDELDGGWWWCGLRLCARLGMLAMITWCSRARRVLLGTSTHTRAVTWILRVMRIQRSKHILHLVWCRCKTRRPLCLGVHTGSLTIKKKKNRKNIYTLDSITSQKEKQLGGPRQTRPVDICGQNGTRRRRRNCEPRICPEWMSSPKKKKTGHWDG